MCQGVCKSNHAPQKVDSECSAQDIGMKLYWNFENLWCISDNLNSRFGLNVPENVQRERRMRINSQEMASWKDRHKEFARRMK